MQALGTDSVHLADVGVRQNSHYFANFFFFAEIRKKFECLNFGPKTFDRKCFNNSLSPTTSLSHSLSLSLTHTHTHKHSQAPSHSLLPWRVFAAVVVFYPDVIAITHTTSFFIRAYCSFRTRKHLSKNFLDKKLQRRRIVERDLFVFFPQKKVALETSCWSC